MTTTTDQLPELSDPAVTTELPLEYWTVTMGTDPSCGSCDSTLSTVREAIEMVGPVLRHLGVRIVVEPRSVDTWDEALRHRIAASPTLRATGAELAPAHVSATSEERRWSWRGQQTSELPLAAIIDLLVQAAATHSRGLDSYLTAGGPDPYLHQYLAPPTSSVPSRNAAASCGCNGP